MGTTQFSTEADRLLATVPAAELDEVQALAWSLFQDGMDWGAAITEAVACYSDVMAFAAEWDARLVERREAA